MSGLEIQHRLIWEPGCMEVRRKCPMKQLPSGCCNNSTGNDGIHSKVDHLEIHVVSKTDETLKEGALKILKHVRSKWNSSEITFKFFSDGFTNHLFGCSHPSNPSDVVLIRVYGEKTELFINRATEVRNFTILHKAGMAPPLYCTFENGLCYGFSPGEVLDGDMVKDPKTSRLIAEEMAKMHTIKDSIMVAKPCLFSDLRKFLSLVPSDFTDPLKDQRYKNFIPSKPKLETEINQLEQHLSQLGSPVVFCHNDLLLKNIVYNQENEQISFIDYEYGDYNYQAFDIGNHFCEFAGTVDFDPSLYPDKEFQVHWLRNYLKAWKAFKGQSPEVTQDDVDLLHVQVNKFALASHLFWGLWALVQAVHSSLDFDFLAYGIERIKEYYARREEVLGLPVASSDS